MEQKDVQKLGKLPLDKEHICFNKGHAMYPQFRMQSNYSEWGRNKCSRCGWEEDWQYDFPGGNPMYYRPTTQ